MKPKARLKITLDCNKACSFCINNNQQYRDSWTRIDSIFRVDWTQFRSIVISGGEPTIVEISHLLSIVRGLRASSEGACIYLQTNGLGLTKDLVRRLDDYIDGVGYSVHSIEEFKHMLTRLRDILKIKPIKLYVQLELFQKHTHTFPQEGFTYKLWELDEFDSNEQIFVLN